MGFNSGFKGLKCKKTACGRRENKTTNVSVREFYRSVFVMETNCASCEVGTELYMLFR